MATSPGPCDDVRSALWPDPAAPAPPEARAHYERCPACQAFFVRDRHLVERLAALRIPAPAAVGERVRAGLASSRRPRPVVGRVAVGTLAAAAAVTLAVLFRPDPMERMLSPFAEEARATAPGALAMTSNDAATLGGWFATALGTPVAVPTITDAVLLGGKVSVIAGRAVAVVLYRLHGEHLTYFAVQNGDPALDALTEGEIMMAADAEVEVAVWREPGGVRAVAAPMPRAEVMAVATECRDKARMAGP